MSVVEVESRSDVTGSDEGILSSASWGMGFGLGAAEI